MEITIQSVTQGPCGKLISFTAGGVAHTATITETGSRLFAFGKGGDSCTTTHEISNPEMLAAVLVAMENK